MELHDLAQYRVSRARRFAGVAIPENRRPRDAAHDEQAGRYGTLPLERRFKPAPSRAKTPLRPRCPNAGLS